MTAAGRANHQIIYAHRPDERLRPEDFTALDSTIGAPGPGEVLCRTVLLSVDPANRAWMQGRTYRDQLHEGEVMAGFTLCEVVAEDGDRHPGGVGRGLRGGLAGVRHPPRRPGLRHWRSSAR